MDLTQPGSQIVVIVLFLVPGFIYLWTYERLAGRLPLTGTERVLRAITMSSVVYAIATAWLVRLARLGISGELTVAEGVTAALTLLLLAPFILGALLAQTRRRRLSVRWLGSLTSLHPAPTAWDFAFETTSAQFVRVKLKDGRFVGGAFGADSFASSYPEPQSMFIEQAWWLTDDGEFVEPAAGTAGLLVRPDEMETVEWLQKEADVG